MFVCSWKCPACLNTCTCAGCKRRRQQQQYSSVEKPNISSQSLNPDPEEALENHSASEVANVGSPAQSISKFVPDSIHSNTVDAMGHHPVDPHQILMNPTEMNQIDQNQLNLGHQIDAMQLQNSQVDLNEIIRQNQMNLQLVDPAMNSAMNLNSQDPNSVSYQENPMNHLPVSQLDQLNHMDPDQPTTSMVDPNMAPPAENGVHQIYPDRQTMSMENGVHQRYSNLPMGTDSGIVQSMQNGSHHMLAAQPPSCQRTTATDVNAYRSQLGTVDAERFDTVRNCWCSRGANQPPASAGNCGPHLRTDRSFQSRRLSSLESVQNHFSAVPSEPNHTSEAHPGMEIPPEITPPVELSLQMTMPSTAEISAAELARLSSLEISETPLPSNQASPNANHLNHSTEVYTNHLQSVQPGRHRTDLNNHNNINQNQLQSNRDEQNNHSNHHHLNSISSLSTFVC